jgi:hypothetical protein
MKYSEIYSSLIISAIFSWQIGADQNHLPSIPNVKPIVVSNLGLSINNRNESNVGEQFPGIWIYKDEFKRDAFIKIAKATGINFNLQKGHKNGSKITWGNMDFSMGKGMQLKLVGSTLVGTYRDEEGSASDAHSDIKVTLEITSKNTLSFKSELETIEAKKYK